MHRYCFMGPCTLSQYAYLVIHTYHFQESFSYSKYSNVTVFLYGCGLSGYFVEIFIVVMILEIFKNKKSSERLDLLLYIRVHALAAQLYTCIYELNNKYI